MPKSIPLQTGQKFGRLTVVSLHHIRKHINKRQLQNKEYYLCKCECGNTAVVEKFNLGRCTNSCGCFDLENKKKHGHYGTRIYKTWSGIKNRCLNKKNKQYKNYGGRGITICEEWKNDFMSFYNWAIQNGYKDNLTIDRIENNGNYEPSNCRFISNSAQQRNRRNNRIIEYNGEKNCMVEWADKFGISDNALYMRLYSGWSIERALTSKKTRNQKNT